jgi:hypothetical protein
VSRPGERDVRHHLHANGLQRGGTVLMARTLRVLLVLAVLGGLLWLLGARAAFAATYYVNATAATSCTGPGEPNPCCTAAGQGATCGNDSNPGTSSQPWQTWGRVMQKTATGGGVGTGDTILFRAGRYASCAGRSYWTNWEPVGGTAQAPLTLSVDPDANYPGDVELHGGAEAGQCDVPAWTQGRACTAGPYVGAVCNDSTECGTGGTCTVLPGVWWTLSQPDNDARWYGGLAAGVAYQPTKAGGGTPRIYEIVYSQPGAQERVPTAWLDGTARAAGYAQALPYGMLPAAGIGGAPGCTSERTPWFCCAAANSGSCIGSRIYVLTPNGLDPDAQADATYGNVEFPRMPSVIEQGTGTVTGRNIKFTNNANGRRWHFRWPVTSIFTLKNIDGLTVEDFTMGYTSRVYTFIHGLYGTYSNSAKFPRWIAGDSYGIYGWYNTNGTNVVKNTAWRRGQMGPWQGNEFIHFLQANAGRSIYDFGYHTFETLVMCGHAWSVPNGEVSTPCAGNAWANFQQRSWPPPGYSNWQYRYSHGFYSPLGGGGKSDHPFISTAYAQTLRNIYVFESNGVSLFESGGAGGLVVENNVFDFGLVKWNDKFPGFWPMGRVSECLNPDICNGSYDGRLGLTLPVRYEVPGLPGPIVRNNVFLNIYGEAFRAGWFINYDSQGNPEPPPANPPATPAMIVNNTIYSVGDTKINDGSVRYCLTGGNRGNPCTSDAQCSGGSCWAGGAAYGPISIGITDVGTASWDAADGSKPIFKNNIVIRTTPSFSGKPMIEFFNNTAAQTDLDYNLWHAASGAGGWKIGGTTYSDFASWQTAIKTSPLLATNETHSLFADPLFRGAPTDLSLAVPGSPAYESGVSFAALSPPRGFDFDVEGTARSTTGTSAWSRGAYEGAATGSTVIPTTTTTTSTSTTPTSSTTTTTVGGTTTTSTSTTTTTTTPPGVVAKTGGLTIGGARF